MNWQGDAGRRRRKGERKEKSIKVGREKNGILCEKRNWERIEEERIDLEDLIKKNCKEKKDEKG